MDDETFLKICQETGADLVDRLLNLKLEAHGISYGRSCYLS